MGWDHGPTARISRFGSAQIVQARSRSPGWSL
jgi:hypothetical protein